MELKQILETCREYGVIEFESADFKLKLALTQIAIPVTDGALKQEIGTEANPSEDQFLFMSSGEDVFATAKATPPEL